MKRLVYVLLVVTIAAAGCADKKQSKVTVVSGLLDGVPYGTWDNVTALKRENARLRIELSKANSRAYQQVPVQRFDRIERVLLQRISKLEDNIEVKWNTVDSAEAAIEAQRVTIEVLQTLCRLYEGCMSSQRTTIEILKKMCRLYDNDLYLEG